MTNDQAKALVLTLRAAFPRPEWDKATQALYVGEFGRLKDFEAAQVSVQGVIRGCRFRPSIAEILAEYHPAVMRQQHSAADKRGLPPPPSRPTRAPKSVPPEVIEWMRANGIPVKAQA